MFTEITGYQRDELIDRDLSKIAPRLFKQSGSSGFEMLKKSDAQIQGFINHKFNHLIAVEYTVGQRTEDNQIHIVFKLSSASNMKLVVLAKENGEITDYNLLAQNAFKKIQEYMIN